jgi:hypothetical protein
MDPSTVVPEAVFRDAIRPLLYEIASLEPDVVVAEAGAAENSAADPEYPSSGFLRIIRKSS